MKTRVYDPVGPGLKLGFFKGSGESKRLGSEAAFNGNISAVKWNILKEKRGYAYNYDTLNRIKKAQHKIYSTVWQDSNPYSLELINYDLNGNIQNLTRHGKNLNMDILNYDYTGNQLLAVRDDGVDTVGFKDGNTSGNDYEYDANGNMTKDLNKGIVDIDYNHLNLPSKVIKDANNYIEYIYDAAGIKLAQIVQEEGQPRDTTLYAGEFIYENNSLQFIQHEEGRIIPASQSISGNNEYQYHLKDHLGNTRVSFTTRPQTVQFDASFETENAVTEEELFYNIAEARVTMLAADANSDGGNEVVRVNSTQPMGAGIGLPVGAGDIVNMHVYAYYEGGSGYNSSVGISALISAVAGGFGGVDGGSTVEQAIYDNFDYAYSNPTNGIGLLGTSNDNVPAAYINYILFDKDMVMYKHGYNQISSAANWSHEKVDLNGINVPKNGFLYVYITNESASTNWVYFDDMHVEVKEHPVIQADNYYPFGLTFNSFQRSTAKENKWKFQGQEHIDDLDLGWVQFKWRNHDPAIGRFFNVDPLAESYVYNSPYAFSENHVTSHVELEGLEKISIHSASFAPFDKFGGNYKGDGANRKFGANPNSSSRIRGRSYLNVTGNGVTRTQQSEPKGSTSHNLKTEESTYSEARMTTTLSDSKGDGTNASAKFGFHVSGNNDLVPGSWDIDAKGNLNISTVQGENGSTITFSGKISGDGFPANETFISDANGTGVMLGASGADGNPYTTLAGDNNRTMSEFNLSVNFNKAGEIQSVIYNGTSYSVEDWNKQFTQQDPQSDVKTTYK
jgi:RHS repeat-associated protein